MRAIWKFDLEVTDDFTIRMPLGAKPLAVQMQNGAPCLWAEVDTTAEKSERKFSIFGTGHPLPTDSISYIGTFQMAAGALVFHAYERLIESSTC